MRANEQSSERARARASVVLPTPGTSSTSTCPSASSATTARSTVAGSPLTARRTFAITRSAASRALSSSRGSASAASIASSYAGPCPGDLHDPGSVVRTARITLPGIALVATTFGLARYGYGLLVPEMRRSFGLDATTVGLLASGA